MCGIVGKVFREPGRVVGADEIRRMCDTIVHRGPDDEGVYVSDQVGLGVRRLSIIDPAGGHQPMRTADGRFTIVFNGEIYNYRDVRKALEPRGCRFHTASDTECVMLAYALDGAACLRYLNGMFAIAIWDAQERELFLARDRVGIKPLYVHQSGCGLSFASEIKALLSDPDVPRSLDREAFEYFLRYGYVTSPATLLEGVRQVPPGHYLRVGQRGISTHEYWSLGNGVSDDDNESERLERVYALTKRAVERQMVSDVPLGAFLSGGVDSSTMVHLMTELTGGPVSTYSIGFAGVDSFHNELDDARFVCNRYGTTHHEIIVRPDVASLVPRLVDHLDQPLADSSFIVTYLISALARGTVKVIVSGVGGDEVFAGYRRYLGPSLDYYYRRVPGILRKGATAVSTMLPVDRGSAAKNYFRLARSFLAATGSPYDRYDSAVRIMSPEHARELCPSLGDGESSLMAKRRSLFDEVPETDPLGQILRLDFRTSLVDSLLKLTDKMSMAASLEARVPLLDHELVETVAAIPSSAKIRNGRLRAVQKDSMRGRLPDRVLRKKKRGFGCPVGAWFRTDLRPLLRDTLSTDSLTRQGLLDPRVVSAAVEQHEQFRQDQTDLLLALLTFQLWFDRWRVSC